VLDRLAASCRGPITSQRRGERGRTRTTIARRPSTRDRRPSPTRSAAAQIGRRSKPTRDANVSRRTHRSPGEGLGRGARQRPGRFSNRRAAISPPVQSRRAQRHERLRRSGRVSSHTAIQQRYINKRVSHTRDRRLAPVPNAVTREQPATGPEGSSTPMQRKSLWRSRSRGVPRDRDQRHDRPETNATTTLRRGSAQYALTRPRDQACGTNRPDRRHNDSSNPPTAR